MPAPLWTIPRGGPSFTWVTLHTSPLRAMSDFVPLAARAAAAAWLSMQIVICSFTSLFLKQLVTQSSIAATFAWKAVASCPSAMCYCILIWYSQIPATVSCWLQAPSVNQTCPFLSQLSQSLSHSSLVGIAVRYLPNMRFRVTWSFIMLISDIWGNRTRCEGYEEDYGIMPDRSVSLGWVMPLVGSNA